MPLTPNYTLGRGKVYFSRFVSAQTPGAWRYIGNTPEFNLTVDSEDLEHFSSDQGIRELDDSVPLQVTRSGTLVCDDIQAENVALFFFGSTSVLTTSALATQSENFNTVQQNEFYQIGVTASNPVGIRGISNVSVTDNPMTTTYTVDVDYTVDLARGFVEILDTGAIANDDDITVNYDIDATNQDQVISGSTPVEGAMRYLENNPRGLNRDVFLPYVKITPNGDLSFKGDEWRQIPFAIQALKPTASEAIYINGQPA